MNIHQNREFETLVMEHKSTIYSVCYMFAQHPEDVNDLFQEVLVNLWSGIGSFRGEAAPRSWVYRVAMNTCISHRRRKQPKTVPLDVSHDVMAPDTDHGRQADQLRRRISLLEPVDRAIVLLWLENMSYDEIGSIVGISPRAVGVRLVRIKEKLKSL